MLSKVFQATADKRRESFRIEHDFDHVVIHRESSVSIFRNLLDGCPERISFSRTDHAGNLLESAIRIRLGDMVFFKQMLEKAIVETFNATTGVYLAELPLKLVSGVGFQVLSSDIVTLDIDEAIVGAKYTLHVLESPFFGDDVIKYTRVQNLNGSTRKEIDVDHALSLVIPVNAPITRVVKHYPSGQSTITNLDEALIRNCELNDMECRRRSFNLEALGGGDTKTEFCGPEESQLLMIDVGDLSSIDLESDGEVFEVTSVALVKLNK